MQFMIPKIALISLLSATSILLYFNSLDCGFVFDDITAIKDNKDLRPETPLSNLFVNDFWGTPIHQERSHKSYRPLTVLTFRWNYLLGELNPSGYHAINVILHAVVVILFFQLCSVYFDIIHSFLSAVLFAVHPIHTEAVTGVVGRAELLSSVFFLLSLLIHINIIKNNQFRAKDILGIILVLILVSIGTLCKEQCITALSICFGLEAYHILRLMKCQKLKTEKNYLVRFIRSAVIFSGAAGIMFFRLKINGKYMPFFTDFDNPAAHSPFPTRQLTFNYLTSVNLRLLFCPLHLCCDWTMGTIALVTSITDPRILGTLCTYGFIGLLSFIVIKKIDTKSSETLAMSLLIMVLSFLPASNLFISVGFVVAERVLYTPSLGFCLMIGLWLQKSIKYFPKFQKLIYGSFVVLLLSHTMSTYYRNFDWRNEYTLFMSALQVNQNNAKLWNNVGHSLEHEKKFEEALRYFTVASKTQPNDVGSHINVGRTLVNLQRYFEAEEAFKLALSYMPQPKKGQAYTTRVSPKDLNVFINLSNLLIKNKTRLLEADSYLRRAISMRPDFVDAYQNRGDILLKLNRSEEARNQYITALQYRPNSADLHYNLGVVNIELKRNEEALTCFHTSLKLDQNHKPARLSLASFYSEDPLRRDEAKSIYYDLIKADFEAEKCHFALAMMETDDKNFQLAEKHYLQSLKYDHISRGSLFNLALLYNNELKKFDDALTLLNRLLENYPNHVKGHLLLGDILLNYKRDLSAAFSNFQKASDLEPKNAQAKHNLCVVMVEQNRLVEAESCLVEAAKLSPTENYIKQHLNIVRNRLGFSAATVP